MQITKFLTKLYPLLRVHQVYISIRITRTTRIFWWVIIGKTSRTDCPLFSRNHNHAIGRSCSVKSRGRSVFQYINTFNILWINPGNSITDNINIIRIILILSVMLLPGLIHRILNVLMYWKTLRPRLFTEQERPMAWLWLRLKRGQSVRLVFPIITHQNIRVVLVIRIEI